MAIGDCASAVLGAAAANRQPASGVFEEISAINKSLSTSGNDISTYDGTTSLYIFEAGLQTDVTYDHSEATRSMSFSMSMQIGNAVYLRKNGAANKVVICLVQTDT
jgi:hypothetical protein